jgi:hypothetical protein
MYRFSKTRNLKNAGQAGGCSTRLFEPASTNRPERNGFPQSAAFGLLSRGKAPLKRTIKQKNIAKRDREKERLK